MITLFENMAAPVTRMGSSLAAKRARSQDSKRSLTASPVPKAAKTEEVQEDPDVPAFLRQSKAGRFKRHVIMHTRSVHDLYWLGRRGLI